MPRIVCVQLTRGHGGKGRKSGDRGLVDKIALAAHDGGAARFCFPTRRSSSASYRKNETFFALGGERMGELKVLCPPPTNSLEDDRTPKLFVCVETPKQKEEIMMMQKQSLS